MSVITGSGKLAAKLARIMLEIGKVPKSGYNAFHKYNYVTENDLVYAVRDKLSAEGIFVFTSVESQVVTIVEDAGEKSALTTVVTMHTFVDGESGEQFTVKSAGQGADKGDKGGYKAITGAMKYFIYKSFMIPTGDDPEADTKTDERNFRASGQNAPQHDAPASKTPPPRTETKTTEVPRDGSLALRDKFRKHAWENVQIHFGKNEGVALGRLEEATLGWYISKWQPKPFKGSISEDDKILRAALDVADEELTAEGK